VEKEQTHIALELILIIGLLESKTILKKIATEEFLKPPPMLKQGGL
jgi:hypothetical protein